MQGQMQPKHFFLDDEERQSIRPKGSKLHVLFNLDPYSARMRNVVVSRLKEGEQLLSSLRNSEYFDLDYRFFGSTSFVDALKGYSDLQSHFVSLSQSELLECFDHSFRLACRSVFLNSPEETPEVFAQSCLRALGDFVPDIILAFGPTNYLRCLYPETAVIHFDSGFISRAPYPRFVGLDPLGHQGQGVVGKYWDQILHGSYSEEEIAYANWVWDDMFLKRQTAQNPMAELLPHLVDPGKKLFLIATQNSEWYNFYGSCDFDDEIHFINHSMSRLPDDCQVIITMHGWNEQRLRAQISDLAAEDSRIIDDDRIYDVPMTSQPILPFCNGVICISSGVGIQAKMWGVPLACPGESHLTRMCDTTDVSKLHKFDPSPEGKQTRRDEIAGYVHFAAAQQSVLQSDWHDPEHLVDIILTWLDCASQNAEPLAYFHKLGNRDFQQVREATLKNLVDLTPDRLEIWRLAEKGLLKQVQRSSRSPVKARPLRKWVSGIRRLLS